MSRIAYVNGRYLPHRDACVHVEDRGYQFADGVYEVCEVRGGKLIDERRHLDRLDRSLTELRIAAPMSRGALTTVLRETVRRNLVRDGLVYLQVTRGVARRDHGFPAASVPPSIVVTARSANFAKNDATAAAGMKVISLPENRWDRVDIKSVGLLPNVLAKQAAREAGAGEAWFVDAQGHVTEGASTNAWIVTQDGRLVTRPAEHGILRGITRTVLMEVAAEMQLKVEERAFTLDEAKAAKEAFVSSATSLIMPVIAIDGTPVGTGTVGPVARNLRAQFHKFAEASA
ncbi:MAG: D-amino acid aminotransferase [Rhizobiales bacterium 24-66-13]|jgi:D-alanine transaminase|uniref:D-amino-acid transaminase n=1 Tax=Roseixanthobacter finlandensis TaxID=3119922 RepID=UPI000BC88EE3|nr:MAG: D-amino acid aminotransferase [Rhizobiales bacterium 35-66-30]OYZ81629.1 MAG: D-amino acid aminotransferase [Rhizobiales bacterium 24-66-13]OZA95563.1 MAG: D-amino acid aminotransferase [Rhizobiales bacterium 39-66-18]HQS09944.1 D-amino-acid transaminase [Xanthobacteraceae bacterium]HQS45215.1 D-amino-acid transaminase [Xanthobacteraceae bacterium]